MAFKLKYKVYPKRGISKNINTGITTAILELGIGIVCFLFAYADWGNGKTMLFWPFIIVAGFCFTLVLYSLVEWLYLNVGVKSNHTDNTE